MAKKYIQQTLTYAEIILLAVLNSFNYYLFIIENDFAPAGINGIATMIQYKTGFSIAYMSLLINLPLCILAYLFLNKAFAKRSLCFCLFYSGIYLLLQHSGLDAFQYDSQGQDTILPVIISGLLSGVAYGFCFRLNASTGGTSIISNFINKRFPSLNFFWVTFSLNAVVAAVSFFVYAKPSPTGGMIYDYKPVCLCVMYCFITSFTGNYIIQGTKSAYKFTVITSHADEITADILRVLKHGCTRIAATGSYSQDPRDVLICVINKHQILDFQNILKKYDNTFSFSEHVNEIYGNFVRFCKHKKLPLL